MKTTKKLTMLVLCVAVMLCTCLSAAALNLDSAEAAEGAVAYLAEDAVVPGVNAFTGTTAVKNFTAEDLNLVTVTDGYAEKWNGGDRLRLRPNTPGTNFSAKIALPLEIDRPALTMSNVWLMSGQCSLNGTVYTGPWESDKTYSNAHVDTGADKAYGKDYVSLAVADQGGTNIYIFWQMAVVPYYQITYKNVLPDGSTGEDVIKYYLGTEAEKAAITNAAAGITGLPTSYSVEDVALTVNGYTLAGWSLTEGGEAVDTVALAQADVVLYPIWEASAEEPEEPEEPVVVPGVNAFTGTTAIKNFTAEDLDLVTVTGGYAIKWLGGDRLRLHPNTAGSNFSATIALPYTIDRPALTMSDVWVQSGQCMLNGTVYTGPWEAGKTFNNAHVDTGADTAYGKDYVSLVIADQGGTNIYIFWQMAVVPYYQITYKNVLPDGSTGEDVVKYYLGTDEEKAAITNAAAGITGLPTSYAVEDVTLTADGYKLAGWSLTEGGEAVDTVALAQADVVLYPVWEASAEEPEEPEEPVVVPGVNAFTGTTAIKNFTAADIALVTVTDGYAEKWNGGDRLRLRPNTPGTNFSAKIALPLEIDRPALTMSELWLMSGQCSLDGTVYTGPWENQKFFNNAHVDTGADKAYGKDYVSLAVADQGGTNIYIFWQMAVVPYYQITYKNVLPDGSTGEDVVKYYLGTDEEKAAITNAATGITGLPTSYAVEDVALTAAGYTITGWSLTEGGEAVDTVALANEDIVLYPIWEYDSEVLTPVTQDTTEIRTSSPSGIRFKAEVSHKVRRIENEDVEYGFIVTTEHLIGEKELTFDSGVQYAQGKAYSTTENIDIVFAEGDAGVIFTGVLIGVPDNKDAYTTEFIARSYVKIGDTYFYGDTHTDSLYDAVSRVDESIVAEFPYLQNIIDTVEK